MEEKEIEKYADEYIKTHCDLSGRIERNYARYDFIEGFKKAEALRQPDVIKSVCEHPYESIDFERGIIFCKKCNTKLTE